jgi:hypothetical protein
MEMTMRNRESKRTAPAALTLAACVALLGTFATMEHADARGIHGLSGRPPLLDRAPSIQPHFNPSVPYTVPQSPERPVSPGSPGSVFGPG